MRDDKSNQHHPAPWERRNATIVAVAALITALAALIGACSEWGPIVI